MGAAVLIFYLLALLGASLLITSVYCGLYFVVISLRSAGGGGDASEGRGRRRLAVTSIAALVFLLPVALATVVVQRYITPVQPAFSDVLGIPQPKSVSGLRTERLGTLDTSDYLHCSIAPQDVRAIIQADNLSYQGTFSASQVDRSFNGRPAWWSLPVNSPNWSEYKSIEVNPSRVRYIFVTPDNQEIYGYYYTAFD